ncbi:MAG: hypothetical protein WC304_03025 [Candidatus Gracilibacteria bacterium]
MANSQLIKETLQYLQLSSMEAKEKAMWMLLIPEMEEDKITRLHASLKKEVDGLTEIYLEATSAGSFCSCASESSCE